MRRRYRRQRIRAGVFKQQRPCRKQVPLRSSWRRITWRTREHGEECESEFCSKNIVVYGRTSGGEPISTENRDLGAVAVYALCASLAPLSQTDVITPKHAGHGQTTLSNHLARVLLRQNTKRHTYALLNMHDAVVAVGMGLFESAGCSVSHAATHTLCRESGWDVTTIAVGKKLRRNLKRCEQL